MKVTLHSTETHGMRHMLTLWIQWLNEGEGHDGLAFPPTSREQLLAVLQTRYQPAHMFEWVMKYLLDACAAQGSYESLVKALCQNLEEERGEGENDYGPAHVLGRRAFFKALGLDYTGWERGLTRNIYILDSLCPAARNLIAFYRELINTSPLAGGAGMLYWEGRIARLDYPLLLERVDAEFGFSLVENTPPRTATLEEIPPRWHLQSHAEHDVIHEADLIEAVVGLVQSPADVALVKTALLASQKAWNCFWLELKNDI